MVARRIGDAERVLRVGGDTRGVPVTAVLKVDGKRCELFTRFCFGFRAFLGKRRARGDDCGDRPDRADRFGIDVAGGLAVDGDLRIGAVLGRGKQRDIDVCGELSDGRRLCVRRGEDRDGAERFADIRCAVAGILLAADAEQRAVAVSGRAVLQRDARPVRAGVLQNPDRVTVGKLCGDDGKV